MDCQKHRFSLPDDIHYLNCATRGPLSKKVESAGVEAILNTTTRIHLLTPDDFFTSVTEVRRLFAQLVHAPDPERVALVPAVSYAMGVVARNLPTKPGFARGQKIILLEGEFPSDVYAWERVAAEYDLEIVTVAMPAQGDVGSAWNHALLSAIDAQTALVVCAHVHWMHGVRFDLAEISKQTKEVGAWLVVDGTQSVGALPFDLTEIQPDVLVCGAYKWLMGPYAVGLAYFGAAFDEGIPLEETWMGREGSNLFHRLTEYQPQYRTKAFRYNMGEQSNFMLMPMLKAALEQLLEWQPMNIQQYCQKLMQDAIPTLQERGFALASESHIAYHLLGLRLPNGTNVMEMQKALAEKRVYVSARGSGLRISPQIYNTPEDVAALLSALIG